MKGGIRNMSTDLKKRLESIPIGQKRKMTVEAKYKKLGRIYHQLGELVEPLSKQQRFGYVSVEQMIDTAIDRAYEDISDLKFKGDLDAHMYDLWIKAGDVLKPIDKPMAVKELQKMADQYEVDKKIMVDYSIFDAEHPRMSLDSLIRRARSRYELSKQRQPFDTPGKISEALDKSIEKHERGD